MNNVIELLEKTCRKFPDKTGFAEAEREESFSVFRDHVCIIAGAVAERGIDRAPCAVYIPKSIRALECFLGVAYSGNFYCPVDTEMPKGRVRKILEVLKPAAVITDEEHLEELEGTGFRGWLCLYEDIFRWGYGVDGLFVKRMQNRILPQDPLYVLFTSGTTGTPKGIVASHRNILAYTKWAGKCFGLDEETVYGSQTPFYFTMSVFDIYGTIRNGGKLQIIPKELFAFPLKLLQFLNLKKINTLYWVPSALCMVSALKALDRERVSCLKRVLFSGETMPVRHLNYWREKLPDALYANLFGPTEVTDAYTYYIVDRQLLPEEKVPIGRPCDNCDVLLVNGKGERTRAGEVGEIYVRGDFLTLGYYNAPEKTEEAFVANPFQTGFPERMLKTGDLAAWDEEGILHYRGRNDFQIKHMGNRIELGEIEAAAEAIRFVERCACIFDEERDKIVLFYQSGREDHVEVRKRLEEKLPRYMLPNVMIGLPELPVNRNGKLDRRKLKEIYRER